MNEEQHQRMLEELSKIKGQFEGVSAFIQGFQEHFGKPHKKEEEPPISFDYASYSINSILPNSNVVVIRHRPCGRTFEATPPFSLGTFPALGHVCIRND